MVQQCDRSGIGDVSNGLPIDALQQSRRDLVPVFYERPHAIGIEHEIMLISGMLRRWQIMSVALVCAILQEAFSNLPSSEAIVRLILSFAGFVGTGLFVFELVRNRRIHDEAS